MRDYEKSSLRGCLTEGLVVEVMKMCMPLLLPASGVIHFVMSEGQAMQASGLIARWDLVGPSSGRSAEPFHGTFPKLEPPTAISGKVHQKFAASANSAHMILAGYERSINHVPGCAFSFRLYKIC
ncbi:acetyl-CoA carboxylase 1-like [Aegilops tauschii subsp. strangulata]|uniref:acetyl-CoA carboxylase 1-like n=1 Tax=Aegilops tauschii subsp. strangulata TaxID=200361 RepID=UPI00098A5A5A|nr:acetyl-CoA carboxylase 1-like isoform X2 [Triticum aestivum]XP_045084264.1 acetyl-CoA carboxylase 1-like isoform X2 [Aegilops tauschii subsp. strangulata]